MSSQVLGLRVAGIVFGVLCLAQLLRLATQFDVVIGGTHLPFWPSGVAVVVLGALSIWMWKLSCNARGL